MRPASIASRMSRSDRIIGAPMLPGSPLETSTQRARASAAAPASIARRGCHAFGDRRRTPRPRARRRRSAARRRGGSGLARQHRARRSPPTRRRRRPAGPRPSPREARARSGSRCVSRTEPSLHLVDGREPRGRELVEPVLAPEQLGSHATSGEDLGHQRQHPLVGDPDDLCVGARGVRERSEEVEHRRDAQLATDRPRVRHRRVELGANMNAMPASARQRSTPAASRSIVTPSASSRSAEPQCELAARFPCLATGTPAPATTIARDGGDVERAAAVAARAARCRRRGRRAARGSRTRASCERDPRPRRRSRPWSASAIRKPPICPGVASPAMIRRIAAAASSASRASRAHQPREQFGQRSGSVSEAGRHGTEASRGARPEASASRRAGLATLRLRAGGGATRVWFNGRTRASQARNGGSIPLTRSHPDAADVRRRSHVQAPRGTRGAVGQRSFSGHSSAARDGRLADLPAEPDEAHVHRRAQAVGDQVVQEPVGALGASPSAGPGRAAA